MTLLASRTVLHGLAALTFGLAAVAFALPARAADAACPALLDHRFDRLQDEKPQDLCQYKGKVVLVVNTASFCGFTPQYKALESLHAQYGPRGLVVLGFPSNDFGAQEPGNNGEIAAFCENTFGVKFPMFTKAVVRPGPAGTVNPLFAQLGKRTGQTPGWNFHKYLIARNGVDATSFASEVDPGSAAFRKQVEKLLDAR
jgi:glutathione peroxidase